MTKTSKTTGGSVKKETDFPANPEEKDGYVLEFCDNFEGEALDTRKWLPYYLPQWSSKEQTRARYRVQDGQLQLRLEADQEPCSPEYTGNLRVSSLQTGCLSGPVGSPRGQHPFRDDLIVREAQPTLRHYTPQYGYFEVRLKAVALPGYMCALWLIGFEEEAEQSAEICICELRGEHITAAGSVNGYGVHPFNDPAIKDEFYEDVLDIDASNFHIYAADWTPNQIDFYSDDVKVRTITQSPDYAMQFMLNIYELPDALTPEAKNAPFPKTMVVDYVRGYRRDSSPSGRKDSEQDPVLRFAKL